MKLLLFVIPSILLIQCSTPLSNHKSAKEIYESGKIEINDFILKKNNDSSGKDYYQYKYDTALILEKSYFDRRQYLAAEGFYYHGQPEGKCLIYEPNGQVSGEVNYHNGKENGFLLVFEKGKLTSRLFYKEGKPMYMVTLDTLGNVIDSVSSR